MQARMCVRTVNRGERDGWDISANPVPCCYSRHVPTPRAYRASKTTRSPCQCSAWKGMGTGRTLEQAVRPLYPVLLRLLVIAVLVHRAHSDSACRVTKCNSEFVASTAPLNPAIFRDLVLYCRALRQATDCARRTARNCRGDLHYHSTIRGFQAQMQSHNCTHVPTDAPVEEFPPVRPGSPHEEHLPPMCAYRGGPSTVYRHCGLFGDPHLRTFYDDFQTCKVDRAWPLIDNAYLAVQVTNVPVAVAASHGFTATATTKLTVIVKGEVAECAREKVYQAQQNNLPDAFADGTRSGGPNGIRSLVLDVRVPGRHVEIHVRYIDTTIVLRQIGNYLTFAIRMPEDVINTGNFDEDGLQLCVKGCPLSERIDYVEFLRNPPQSSSNTVLHRSEIAMPKDMAIQKCRQSNVTDFYLDSCVFDLMTTGDANFTLAAKSALEDVYRLHPNPGRTHRNRTIESTISGSQTPVNSAPSRTLPRRTLSLYMLLISCIILLTNWSYFVT
ncbi:PREDICTED: repulsive guidance molecule A-like isoform X1 [Branchiostoma belcheri]|uniref:Repulsive guidance molecule A-like isoform X1 n=2 Tax=Branchiostoma belcheri TaxID=7741 RepID=A0A6P5AC57_BRABE|nr:PREDICTED: repulsive guidance molecule A-like isoform X1 [Branchiostoma belcheri]